MSFSSQEATDSLNDSQEDPNVVPYDLNISETDLPTSPELPQEVNETDSENNVEQIPPPPQYPDVISQLGLTNTYIRKSFNEAIYLIKEKILSSIFSHIVSKNAKRPSRTSTYVPEPFIPVIFSPGSLFSEAGKSYKIEDQGKLNTFFNKQGIPSKTDKHDDILLVLSPIRFTFNQQSSNINIVSNYNIQIHYSKLVPNGEMRYDGVPKV